MVWFLELLVPVVHRYKWSFQGFKADTNQVWPEAGWSKLSMWFGGEIHQEKESWSVLDGRWVKRQNMCRLEDIHLWITSCRLRVWPFLYLGRLVFLRTFLLPCEFVICVWSLWVWSPLLCCSINRVKRVDEFTTRNISIHVEKLKVAQNSFQHIPRVRFWCVIITTLSQLILQLWYQKNCPITGEHVSIIFVTQ